MRRILLTVALLIAVGGCGTTEPGTTDSEPETTAAAPKAVGLNQPARDGKFQFLVRRVKCGVGRVGGEFLNKTAQGQYCLIYVRVTNIGNEQRTFEQSSQYLFDTAGRRYGTDDAGLYLDEAKSFLEQVNPGNSVNGVLVFDVPKGFKPARIELHDSAFSGGVTVDL